VSAPLVSVLLPVRNAAATLDRCLSSLAAQSLREHEIVAVDDGSSDDSGRLLDAWSRRDARIRVRHTPARGLVAALNTAAAEARAPMLARMDADDVCAPARLAAQRARLQEEPRVDILGSRVAWRGEGIGNASGMQAYVEWQNTLLDHAAIVRDLWVESPLVHPTVMFPAALLAALGGYREFEGPEDYDLWFRAERAGYRMGKHEDTLLEWWDAPTRLTRLSSRYAPAPMLALKLDALAARHLTPVRPLVLWGAGPVGKSWARALRARSHEIAAFVEVDRRKLGMRIHGAPVVAVTEAARFGEALHLAAVGNPEGRARIREVAATLGLADGRDLIAVA
jgi:cellulose synthase/poly-beta-1,6-N-acetylglucosamine synthase-like glycosyltransferase